MTLDYLCQRSYNEGISHSYTQIRKDHDLYTDKMIFSYRNKSKPIKYFIQQAREKSPADWLRSGQNRIEGIRRRLLPTKQERIMQKLQLAHHAGWKFHQAAVQTNPDLLAFVLKKNYLD